MVSEHKVSRFVAAGLVGLLSVQALHAGAAASEESDRISSQEEWVAFLEPIRRQLTQLRTEAEAAGDLDNTARLDQALSALAELEARGPPEAPATAPKSPDPDGATAALDGVTPSGSSTSEPRLTLGRDSTVTWPFSFTAKGTNNGGLNCAAGTCINWLTDVSGSVAGVLADDGTIRTKATAIGIVSPTDPFAKLGSAYKVADWLRTLLDLVWSNRLASWGSVGHKFTAERACNEQRSEVDADITMSYWLRGMVFDYSLAIGWAAGGIGVYAMPYRPGSELAPAYEQSIDRITHAHKFGVGPNGDPHDYYRYSYGPQKDSPTMRVRMSSGPGISYLSSGTFSTAGGLGVGVGWSIVDAGDYSKQARLLEIRYVFPDATPPTSTASVSGSQGRNGWYVSNVDVSIASQDPETCVQAIRYRTDGGPWTTRNVSPWTPQIDAITVSGDGTHRVEYQAQNFKGLWESARTLEVKIDTTPPTVQLTRPIRGYCYVDDIQMTTLGLTTCATGFGVTMQANAADGTSGVDLVSFRAGNSVVGTDFAPPYEYFWGTLTKVGSYATQACAEDRAGNGACHTGPTMLVAA